MDFTIVTPSFNYGHYIGGCLASVAGQEDVTFEHLVMDAGSKDDTAEVVARFPHATFHQEPDKGMSDGINKGFWKAQGEWVMWLNADDRLKPGALRAVRNFVKNNAQADVIYGCWDFINEAGEFLRHMKLFPFRKRMLIQHGCFIGSTACFYRHSTTINQGYLLNEDFHYCMDGEYYARLATAGKKFTYFPVILADFRLHGKSTSQSNLTTRELSGILNHQKQIAEVKAIRRNYGWHFGGVRELEDMADALLQIYFRLERFVLKSLYHGSVTSISNLPH